MAHDEKTLDGVEEQREPLAAECFNRVEFTVRRTEEEGRGTVLLLTRDARAFLAEVRRLRALAERLAVQRFGEGWRERLAIGDEDGYPDGEHFGRGYVPTWGEARAVAAALLPDLPPLPSGSSAGP